MSLTEDIKDFALDLGYSKVGITSADDFADYVQEVNSRYDMYAWFAESPRRILEGAHPRNISAPAKSIIALVHDYSKEAFPEELTGKIGRLYQARAYRAPEHRINGARHRLMEEFLRRNGCTVAVGPDRPERLAAARAGVVNYGKNTFAFAEDIGSFIVLSSFLVDAELAYDEPSIEVDCPPNCTMCIEACPTGALYEPLKMNPLRCIAFYTFHARDEAWKGVTSYIPPKVREKMGTWIHGCDICQEVCPRNRRRLRANLPADEFLAKIAQDFELTELLNMTDEFYEKTVQPLMYNYIRDRKYFQRNAAIALGNTGDQAVVGDLSRAMENP